MGRLAGAVVLITGSSAGIGADCARQFAAEGCKLILTGRRLDRVHAIRDEIAQKFPGIKMHSQTLDVCEQASVENLIKTLPAEFADIEVLINNAGKALGRANMHEATLEDYDGMFDTNVKGLWMLTKAVLPSMIQRGKGHIINISSLAGRDHYQGGAIYCATKAAVDAMSTCLRKELASTPVRVTTIAPGLVETEFSIVRFKGDTEAAANVYKGFTPLTGAEVAECVVFAATRAPHVQVADILLMPSAQGGSTVVHRG